MVALAADGREGLLASDLELSRPAPSYTTVTLQRLIEAGHAPTQLFFIAGADAFAEIATWRGYPTLLDQSHFVVVSRPGHALETHSTALPPIEPRLRRIGVAGADRPPTTDVHVFLMQADTPDVASSTVRSRIAAGATLDGLLPDAVARYIRAHRLYEPAPSGKVLA
jgi:nicotinate-nucleotide adenylyltransferase